ncbi:response regulator [Ramlibacter terrae]|uniref:Response regulator n=1 Tax=Ramlibacter terrae TaxID=2732511 RepID=A0ABX6P268_9BURK|nr:response regulator [Ramlibacter terrae]
MELMGGTISVRSEPGQGSTFSFTVRVPLAELPEEEIALDPAALHGKRVLVVDDHAVNVRVLTRQLRQWGMRVASAESGAKALDVLEQGGHPDVVITDMHMPGMDGVELARLVRELPGCAQLPLVLLSSGFLPGGSRGHSLFNVRLLKPARQSQLHEALVRSLSGEGPAARAALRPDVRKNKTIPVADDNQVNVKVACGILARLGYDAVAAEDGEQAIEAVAGSIASGRRIAAVLMDVHMPRMDGLEATRAIVRRFGDAAADHRADRGRFHRGPRALRHRRHAGLPHQAAADRRAHAHAGPVDRRRAAGIDSGAGRWPCSMWPGWKSSATSTPAWKSRARSSSCSSTTFRSASASSCRRRPTATWRRWRRPRTR